jgi:hypothetical protein
MALNFEILDTYQTWRVDKVFTAAVTNILTSATHGLVDDDEIMVYSGNNPAPVLPAPLTQETLYFVKRIDANTFYLALTPGGATIDITDAGTGTHRFYRSIEYRKFTVDAGTNIFTSNGHGFVEGDAVQVESNSALPTPLISTASGIYYIKYIDVNTYYLSLTSGGDIIDITDAGTGTHWAKFIIGYKHIKDGALITNTTRAGSAMMIKASRLTFSMGDVFQVQFLVISGSFQALDVCTTAHGGSFVLYGSATTVTDDTIVVDGIDESDSTANLNGTINDSVTTVVITDGTVTPALRYIKIDSEWMFVLVVSTNTLTVKRAMFGSTAASHTSGADVYILAEDLPRAIIDEDASIGWGLCSMANGKFEINAPLILGRPDQAGQSILLTQFDRIQCESLRWFGGITYGTIFQSGVGWVDSGEGVFQGLYMNGSNISFAGCDSFEGSTLNIYGGTLYCNDASADVGFSGACNFMTMSFTSIYYASFVFFSNRQACKIYRSWINNQRLSASSGELDWDGVYINFKIWQETYYFLLSGGDATFRNMEMVDSQYDAGGFAFAAGGIKTFIDCNVSVAFGQFLAGVQCIHKKTLTMSTVSETNIDIPNVNIRILDKNEDESVDVTTDAGGDAEPQEVLFFDSDVGENLNPFKYIVNKAGWESKLFFESITAPKVYIFVMDNVRQA